MRRFLAGLALALLGFAGPALAQDIAKDKPGTEALKLYYTVAIAADRCGWPISTNEIAALDKAAAEAQKALNLDEDGAEAFFNTVDGEFAREKNQRCVSGSAIETLYKKTLAEITR